MPRSLGPAYSPLLIKPRVSWWLGLGLAIVYSLSLLVTAILPAPVIVRLTLANFLLVRAWIDLNLHVWRTYSSAIQEATWDQQGIWTLKLATGTKHTAELTGNSLATFRLVILNFRLPSAWGQHSLVLTTDNCDTETLRRLRVRLKLEHDATAQDSDTQI